MEQREGVDEALLAEIEAVAERAGEAILGFYSGSVTVRLKEDSSPVTAADEAAEAIIIRALAALRPGIPIVSEETVTAPRPAVESSTHDLFWLVDPLDGTKEFLSRNGEFTVNIALIEVGQPVLGVVHLPAFSATYAGLAPGRAWVRRSGRPPQRIAARTPPPDGVIVLSSRSHGDQAALDAFLDGRRVANQYNAGSALKFCLLAEGIADLYPRLGRTMEWDTAAGHAILSAAGGSVTTLEGRELLYGKPGYENPHFVARGADERRQRKLPANY
jgi:3'(2'), 5'-bisphosphate nucleotidase